jgi:hypothetical protein
MHSSDILAPDFDGARDADADRSWVCGEPVVLTTTSSLLVSTQTVTPGIRALCPVSDNEVGARCVLLLGRVGVAPWSLPGVEGWVDRRLGHPETHSLVEVLFLARKKRRHTVLGHARRRLT